jgi:hypothetical protein
MRYLEPGRRRRGRRRDTTALWAVAAVLAIAILAAIIARAI